MSLAHTRSPKHAQAPIILSLLVLPCFFHNYVNATPLQDNEGNVIFPLNGNSDGVNITFQPSQDSFTFGSPEPSAQGYAPIKAGQGSITFDFSGEGSTISLFTGPNQQHQVGFNFTVDGQSQSINPRPDGSFQQWIVSITDSDESHAVTVQAIEGSTGRWNLIGYTLHNSLPSTTQSTVPTLAPQSIGTSTSVLSSSSPSSSNSGVASSSTKRSQAGIIAGAIFGVLFTLGILLLITCFLVRRHRQRMSLVADPLVIAEDKHIGSLRPERRPSRFRRLYSRNLPHFPTPPSIWPSSEPSVKLEDALPPIEDPPRIATPGSHPASSRQSQPKFFVTNPSTISSLSSPLSGGQRHSLPEHSKPSGIDSAIRSLSSNTAEAERTKRRRRTEIDPLQPGEEPCRKQTFRTRFFTTNPSSHSSSSVSSGRSGRSGRSKKKKAAEKSEPVPQMAQVVSRSSPAPLLTTEAANAATPTSVDSPRRRGSQQIFFTANPSPRLSDDMQDTESVLSEIPRPRLDKGKGRAF